MMTRPGAFERGAVARVRLLFAPRPGLQITFSLLLLGLLGAFAYVVVDSQSKSRQEAERQFGAEAKISAALTSSIFSASASSAQFKQLGGRTVDASAVAQLAKRSGFGYLAVLDGTGKLLAATPTAPARYRSHRAQLAPHIRSALAGKASLSDVVPGAAGRGSVLEWALPFETSFGRRVAVEAFNPELIAKFVSGYLKVTRSDASGHAYVLDSHGRVIAASGDPVSPGRLVRSPELVADLRAGDHGRYHLRGSSRYFTAAPVEGSPWRVVLTKRTGQLYPVLAGSRSWIMFAVLAAFAAAGAAGLFFLRRALMSGAQLQAMNAMLEARVAERTAAAEDRARELARSNAELEQFASVTSHDLQEPLRKVRMFGDRLRSRLGDDLAAEPAEDLARMQNAAERMQRLIDDLLVFARVSSRGQEFATTDLGQVAQEVLVDLEARVLELDARVELGDLPSIEADRTQMRQLLQNLIGNALKFHREGEPPLIRIHGEVISAHPPRHAWEASRGERCVITVADNGIGFDGKYAERVFGAFERLHSRSEYEGTGIGLSIARKIVWRHGGDITAEGAPGAGATFTVTLPVNHANGNGTVNGEAQ